MRKISTLVLVFAFVLFGYTGSINAAGTEVVSGNTSLGENQPGWFFNRDITTSTPYEFNEDGASIGAGSLYVKPIGATAADKFIGENFINKPVADVDSISYDFKIGSGGVATEEEHFYMNVYANFGVSDDLKFYDCRYNVVPVVGSVAGFTTVTFDPTVAYPVTTRGGVNASPFACPAVPADMDVLSAGSNIRVFALNVGDASVNDVGLDGYLDKVVVSVNSDVTTYDFDPDLDLDDDGVLNDQDKCAGTTVDGSWTMPWGTNRFQVMADGNGVLGWYQNQPVKKGKGTQAVKVYDMDYSYGCNGHQILEMLQNELGNVMNGHVKYGLSGGILKEFNLDMSDGVLDGMYHIETVVVPATNTYDVSSVATLLSGHDYKFKASGTANAGDSIAFDADYSYRTGSSSTWTDSVSTYEYLGDTLLDLTVNNGFVNWDDDATYNMDHVYWYDMAGADASVSFKIYDTYYPGNTGSLMVDIYAQI